MQVNNLGACGGGSGEGGGAGGGSSGCQTLDAKLLANDIARQTRVPHELPTAAHAAPEGELYR